MEKANFGQIVSFLFGIANDCLVDTYDVGDYRKIILPMMVIRRFDAVLEPTKEKVLKMKEQLDAAGITDQDEALCSVAGEAFCNSSPYTLSDLKSRTNQQQLKSDFILYLNGFSQNVQDIIKRGTLLYEKIAGFTDTFLRIGDNLSGLQRDYDKAYNQLSDGNGSVVRQAELLRNMSLTPKKRISARLLPKEEETEEEENGQDK